ncbi:cutinase family protein [Mycobacterium sp. URHB0044]|jgi:cutinase|uniref:cutinase family protein n=1 Tax=Mycobacterium sp. URHB0044 TaxID=1380386 RepID=UPI00068574A3|nr:cutinase family protein [Mycobacterium sp. URHB0044]
MPITSAFASTRLAVFATTAVLASAPAIALVAAAPAASADACPAVEVVFARGTGQAPGVGREGQAFVDALRTQVNGKSVGVYAVDYPASNEFLQAAAGANDASAHVQATAASCPTTKIVLGGYSQGAAVIDAITTAATPTLGFDNILPPEVANHVAAVAVFGNPSNKVGQPLTSLSPLYGAKAIDLCNGADPVCSPGDDRAAHSLYVQSGLVQQGATFAANRVLTGQPSTAAA